jgi:uncharacterized protein (DUF1015 family)
VPNFLPFVGLRYVDHLKADELVAPPYDVLSDAQRSDLEARHVHNSVRIDFPHGKTDPDAYIGVANRVAEWTATNVLRADDAPTFTVYRMTATVSGRTTSTTGVVGALTLEQPGTGDILPHEQTTPKDKADRLSLLRSARINTSPIWGLSLTAGLGKLCAQAASRLADFSTTDEDGVLHEAWTVTDEQQLQAITESIGKNPIVIADGHHRLETALTYQAERDGADDGASAIMAFVVELAPEELEIRAIHRFLDAPSGTDIIALLSPFFELTKTADATETIVDELASNDSLAVVTPSGTWLAKPKVGAFDATVDLDTVRLATALATNAEVLPRYQHDPATILAGVRNGEAAAGVFVRPVRIDQIRNVAQTRTRMPPKATFFWPKPRTGVVFRPLP